MTEADKFLSVSVVIPAFRDAGQLNDLLESLRQQELPAELPLIEILVVETDPASATEATCARFGASYVGIARRDFDHGGTRSFAAQQTAGELLVFLSQDVVFCDGDSLARLLAPFLTDQDSAACYGRQLAPDDATETMKIKRDFSYPVQDDRRKLGGDDALRHHHVLFSNAFGAYRRADLESVGWFGERQLMCEDVSVVAGLLAKGRSVHYVADARVIHRHQESLGKDLARAFDIGASHALLRERMPDFPVAGGLGIRFLGFGVRQLASRGIGGWLGIPGFTGGCAMRWTAYSLGRSHRRLPGSLVRRMSLHPRWWKD